MNMKKTAYIGLEMLKSAVLHAMLKEKQGEVMQYLQRTLVCR